MEFLDHNLCRNLHTYIQSSPIYILTSVWGFPFLHILINNVFFLINSYSNRWTVISHCGWMYFFKVYIANDGFVIIIWRTSGQKAFWCFSLHLNNQFIWPTWVHFALRWFSQVHQDGVLHKARISIETTRRFLSWVRYEKATDVSNDLQPK